MITGSFVANEAKTSGVLFLLANTQFLLKKHKESESNYKASLRFKTSAYEQLKAYQGLGDVFMATKQYSKAYSNYNEALKIAKDNYVTPKITDLNSKLAEVCAAQGKTQKADGYFQNSLKLASKENKKSHSLFLQI